MVTAETAVVLPVLFLVLAGVVAAVIVVGAQLRCVDAARALRSIHGARLLRCLHGARHRCLLDRCPPSGP